MARGAPEDIQQVNVTNASIATTGKLGVHISPREAIFTSLPAEGSGAKIESVEKNNPCLIGCLFIKAFAKEELAAPVALLWKLALGSGGTLEGKLYLNKAAGSSDFIQIENVPIGWAENQGVKMKLEVEGLAKVIQNAFITLQETVT